MHDRRARCRAHACALLWLFAAAVAHADSVYRCRNARGEIAYQDRACGVNEEQSEVALDPLPVASTVSHQRAGAVRERAPAAPRAARRPRGSAPARTEMSWQCRGADGAVFYRHGACPRSIVPSHAATDGGRRGGKGAPTVSVSATPMPRAEACRRLARERGRSGREHDDSVSTYERNAGRDPCRGY